MKAKGHAFPPDTEWQTDFEQRFEYEETADQKRSIEEIKNESFDGCENLVSVTIPETVISIEPDAFSDCRRVRLFVHSGSSAMEYAREEGIAYTTV